MRSLAIDRAATEVGPLPRLLGPAFAFLAPAVVRAHGGAAPAWTGHADVRRSRNPVAWLLCELLRLPRSGRDVPVSLRFEPRGDAERWTRDFAGRRYASDLWTEDGLLVERMGWATLLFRVDGVGGALRQTLTAVRLAGVTFPAWATPRCIATEREEDGALAFDIPVDLPWLGRAIRYSGRLRPVSEKLA
ncbi:DUF4166 domain-containing protein [Sphingomonas aerophila]|uniref:DUF4166 domain-containing protein n=1 Tax=Sphingomonas aerophila TaxID=1344948 RepID=A0A7W9EXF7_9SPHN|nr:DUF4166 domain-containing protein [Sphingomonas aerophila]MBB5716483.1 hypothetical protein [Sphingomonas aerophila]